MYKTLSETFEECKEQAAFITKHSVDVERVKSMIKIAHMDFCAANKIIKNEKLLAISCNLLYKVYYDVLHILIEAYVAFDKIKSANHQCLFSYICKHHRELKLDWKNHESLRIKRNRTIYFGEPISILTLNNSLNVFISSIQVLFIRLKELVAKSEQTNL